jgi:hypothetical protein
VKLACISDAGQAKAVLGEFRKPGRVRLRSCGNRDVEHVSDQAVFIDDEAMNLPVLVPILFRVLAPHDRSPDIGRGPRKSRQPPALFQQ